MKKGVAMKRTLLLAALASVWLAAGCMEEIEVEVGEVKRGTNDNPFEDHFVIEREVIAVKSGYVQYRATFNDGRVITNSTAKGVWIWF